MIVIEAISDLSNVVKEMIVTSASVDRHELVMEDMLPEGLPRCKKIDLVTIDLTCEAQEMTDQQ